MSAFINDIKYFIDNCPCKVNPEIGWECSPVGEKTAEEVLKQCSPVIGRAIVPALATAFVVGAVAHKAFFYHLLFANPIKIKPLENYKTRVQDYKVVLKGHILFGDRVFASGPSHFKHLHLVFAAALIVTFPLTLIASIFKGMYTGESPTKYFGQIEKVTIPNRFLNIYNKIKKEDEW